MPPSPRVIKINNYGSNNPIAPSAGPNNPIAPSAGAITIQKVPASAMPPSAGQIVIPPSAGQI